MAKEKKHNRMYQIYEMRDTLVKTIEQLNQQIDDRKLLIDVLSKSEQKDKFENLIKGLTDEVNLFEESIKHRKKRTEQCSHLISMYEKRDATTDILVKVVTELIEALNIGSDAPIEEDTIA